MGRVQEWHVGRLLQACRGRRREAGGKERRLVQQQGQKVCANLRGPIV